MSIAEIPTEQRFVLRNVDWLSYQVIAKTLGERHVRLTYDRGNLEFMTVSHGHEHLSELLSQFIQVLTDELDLPRQSGGSTTFDREDLERGLEPDKCFYLENEPAVRGKDRIDLTVDPPPDLALEVDVTHSSMDRMAIYAALRVPEVWRLVNGRLLAYLLDKNGHYVESTSSRHFPHLPLREVSEFLARRAEMSETQLVRLFRAWVREQIAKGWHGAGN